MENQKKIFDIVRGGGDLLCHFRPYHTVHNQPG